jgi:hypothetical protein
MGREGPAPPAAEESPRLKGSPELAMVPAVREKGPPRQGGESPYRWREGASRRRRLPPKNARPRPRSMDQRLGNMTDP